MTVVKNGSHDGDFGWRISQEGRGQIDSVVETTDRHLNLIHEKVWSLPFEGIDPVGANDYFLYIKNTGVTNLAITDFRLESSVIGTVEVHAVSGTAVYAAGADIAPTNRYIGSSIIPTAIIKTDTDITGLVAEGVLFYSPLDVVDKLYHTSTSSNVIIPPGQAIALMWDQATGALKGMVSLVELVDES
jgi:hypothetical protein